VKVRKREGREREREGRVAKRTHEQKQKLELISVCVWVDVDVSTANGQEDLGVRQGEGFAGQFIEPSFLFFPFSSFDAKLVRFETYTRVLGF